MSTFSKKQILSLSVITQLFIHNRFLYGFKNLYRKSSHLNQQPYLNIKIKKKKIYTYIKDESHTIKNIIFIIRRIERSC